MKQWAGTTLVAAASAILSSSCDLCGNDETARVPSPSGHLEAVVFTRGCGATTDFSTQISLLKSGASLPDAGGNLFAVAADQDTTSRGSGGGPEVQVRWMSNHSLEVAYQSGTTVFHQVPSLAGVQVQYVRR